MSAPDGDRPRELPLLVGRAGDDPESLLLIGPPRGGEVTVRRWTADNWSAAPTDERIDAMQLLAWVEAQFARGRSLNQSVYGVRLWLRGEGTDPSHR